mgnify:CR=1 FL=1
MAVYSIVTMGDPILRQVAKPVKNINDGVIRLLDNLRDTMREMNGAGLAAPQIGVPKRAIVVDDGNNYYELINPEIIEGDGEVPSLEGCLSIPGKQGLVKRMKKVRVRGLNRSGEEILVEAEDLLARAFQHEIDHLDGILFIDRAEWVESVEQ